MIISEPIHLAARIRSVAESKTTYVFETAQKMRQQGRDIISLAVGEPDFSTPQPIIAATVAALAGQATRYGPVAGLPALRQKLADRFEGYTIENILITNGAKQALFSLFQVLCDAGSEVIVPRPCWVSFTEQIKLAGGIPVLVDTPGHQLDPGRIASAISPHTRAILVNTPNNPTGAVYDNETLTAVVRIAETHGLYIIADEAYQAFCFDGRGHRPLVDLGDDKERIITVRSFSKEYSMTGFRIGYVAADAAIIAALSKLQSHSTGNVCTFAQYGALAALEMDQTIVEQRRSALVRRHELAHKYVSKLFPCRPAQGAFYLFPDISALLQPHQTSADMALVWLEKAGVAVVPGEAFHGPGHLRISFGVAEEILQRAFERISAIM